MIFPKSIGNFTLSKTYTGTLPEAVVDAIGSCESYSQEALEWYELGKEEVLAAYDFLGIENHSIKMIVRAGESTGDLAEETNALGYAFEINLILVVEGTGTEFLESFEDWDSFFILDTTPESQYIENSFIELVKTSDENGEFYSLTSEKRIVEAEGQYW